MRSTARLAVWLSSVLAKHPATLQMSETLLTCCVAENIIVAYNMNDIILILDMITNTMLILH